MDIMEFVKSENDPFVLETDARQAKPGPRFLVLESLQNPVDDDPERSDDANLHSEANYIAITIGQGAHRWEGWVRPYSMKPVDGVYLYEGPYATHASVHRDLVYTYTYIRIRGKAIFERGSAIVDDPSGIYLEYYEQRRQIRDL